MIRDLHRHLTLIAAHERASRRFRLGAQSTVGGVWRSGWVSVSPHSVVAHYNASPTLTGRETYPMPPLSRRVVRLGPIVAGVMGHRGDATLYGLALVGRKRA